MLDALSFDEEKCSRSINIVSGEHVWACLFSDARSHLDPVGEADNLVAVAPEPVFVGSVEEGYRRAELNEWVLELQAKGLKFFQEIVNNVSVAVLEKTDRSVRLHFIYHRLGPGRMYYRFLDDGIVFSSDIRVLAKIAPAKPNPMGLWSIIAWGAVPEPLSVLDGIFAVPVEQAATLNLVPLRLFIRRYCSLILNSMIYQRKIIWLKLEKICMPGQGWLLNSALQ